MINFVQNSNNLWLIVTETPETVVVAGSPVRIGNINGITVDDSDEDGYAVVALSGVYNLTVTNVTLDNMDVEIPTAVTVGQLVYINDGELDFIDTNGTIFGVALDEIEEGESPQAVEIRVMVGQNFNV